MANKEEKLKEDEVEKVEETVTEVEEIQVEEPTNEVSSEKTEALDVSKVVEEVSIEEVVEFDPDKPVTVQPVQFTSFESSSQAQGEINKNLDILMDIKLQMTVELGRTELPVKKVLELTRGSIIELEKVAGEPVELYANGKLVAHGEVVVIEDNFGLRITSITDPDERLKGI